MMWGIGELNPELCLVPRSWLVLANEPCVLTAVSEVFFDLHKKSL